jgi:hypothetical protein
LLQIDDNSDFSSPLNAYPSSSTYTVSSALDVGTYYWRVLACDTAGIWGPISSVWTVELLPLTVNSTQFWPDGPVLDRYAMALDFGSQIDFVGNIVTRARMLAFFTYEGEDVPGESVCMSQQMPGRGSEQFWSTGTYTELPIGANIFEQSYIYDSSAPDDALYLIMWLILTDTGDQAVACWQNVLELSPISP